MGFITSNLKPNRGRAKGFVDRVQAPENQPPEWMTRIGAVGALIVIGIVIAVMAFRGGDDPVDSYSDTPNQAIEINPYEEETPAEDGSAEETAPSEVATDDEPAPGSTAPEPAVPEELSDDYTSTTSVGVNVTNGGETAEVPEGARNLALAGFTAMTNGEWVDLPKVNSPTLPAPNRDYSINTGSLTVTPPSVSGGKTFVFSVEMTSPDGNTSRATITVLTKSDGTFQLRPLN